MFNNSLSILDAAIEQVSDFKVDVRLSLTSVDLCEMLILVFSKCFRAGFGTFSTFKFKVIQGTN